MKQLNPLSVNQSGHLTIGGADTVQLAETYGTPLYVMDEETIREACRGYQQAIEKFYQGNGRAYYASKAFCCKEMCRIVEQEGMGLDVVSEGELYTALSAGFPAEKICFHGNNKTDQELCYALDSQVGRIVVDNGYELARLDRFARERGKKPSVSFRITPGIEAHTHSYIRTGQIDSKFGAAFEGGEAMKLVKQALTLDNISLEGLHCHIGSQIFELDPFRLAAEKLLRFMSQVREETGHVIKELDLGGGFGIRYVEGDTPLDYDRYVQQAAEVIETVCTELDYPKPYLMFEPGRSIAGPAGITLYRLGAVKEIPDVRTYASVDGGMTDNPRYALYQSLYEIAAANKASQPKTKKITLAGKCCESGDLLGEWMDVQELESGDLIAVLATGAYNYSMASNYNRITKPAVVMVKNGEARIAVKRETLEDLIRNDV